jgi:hypothetical protein
MQTKRISLRESEQDGPHIVDSAAMQEYNQGRSVVRHRFFLLSIKER